MSRAARGFAAAAAVLLALATIAGALSAHALQGRLSAAQQNVLQITVSYQFFHSLGLLAVALWLDRRPVAALRAAAWLLSAGIVMFCGSLYGLLTGVSGTLRTGLGVLTPVGGLALILSWVVVALVLLVAMRRNDQA